MFFSCFSFNPSPGSPSSRPDTLPFSKKRTVGKTSMEYFSQRSALSSTIRRRQRVGLFMVHYSYMGRNFLKKGHHDA